ncbi:DUF2501 domain-containing protein [Alcaligenaceae bacterium]|nr:DUF2501 domain-containing protein [Alcaligenaceae bacterium]
MHKTLHTVLLASALSVCLATPAWSSGLMDSIKSQATESLGGITAPQSTSGTSAMGSASGLGGLGGTSGLGAALGLPSIGGDTAGNAAGVLQYCIQNKYLGGTDAASVKDKLLSKVGIGGKQEQQQDSGYQQGLAGMLSGSGGSSFDLSKLKSDLKDKACSYVLDNASSLL